MHKNTNVKLNLFTICKNWLKMFEFLLFNLWLNFDEAKTHVPTSKTANLQSTVCVCLIAFIGARVHTNTRTQWFNKGFHTQCLILSRMLNTIKIPWFCCCFSSVDQLHIARLQVHALVLCVFRHAEQLLLFAIQCDSSALSIVH